MVGCYGIQLGYFEIIYSVRGLPSREEYIAHELKLVKDAFWEYEYLNNIESHWDWVFSQEFM